MDKSQLSSLILIFAGIALAIYFFHAIDPEYLDLALVFPGALVGAGLDQWKK